MAKKRLTTFCENPLTLKDFHGLPSDGETILLDDESLEVMYGIQETMRTLEPKGLEDVRTLWIETIGHRNSIVWYQVSVRIYKDMHGLCLSSELGESYYFTNKDNWNREEHPTRHNCKKFLERLWGYLCAVVQEIRRDSKLYVRYLEEHVPYQEREGHVVRGLVQDILPGIKIEVAKRKETMDLLMRKRELRADGYETMTLRRYIEAWKVAYCAYCGSTTLEDESAEEVFRRSNCGQALTEYDLDSPEGFARWDRDQNPYHCYDVVYVQIHLYPERESETGRWHFDLEFGLGYYADAGFWIAAALEKAGVPFVIGWADEKLSALRGEDRIYFSPDNRDYQLPYPGEDGVTIDQVNRVIELTTWKKFEEVRYQYCAMSECPYGWNVLERMGGRFCVLPELSEK